MARYINLDDVVLKGIGVFDENLDLLIPLSDVRKALQMTPTADVVPKNEVEELYKEIDRLSQVVLYHDSFKADEIKDAEAEVAREIFGEIEKCMAHDYIPTIGVYKGALELRIAELKKKYTEDKNV